MSNVTQFFAELTSSQPVLRVTCLVFALATSLVVPVFLYSIIWYERYGSDNKRTLLNKFASLACWAAIEYYLVAQMLEIITFLFAPLPAQFCLFTRYQFSQHYLLIFFVRKLHKLLFCIYICTFLAIGFWRKSCFKNVGKIDHRIVRSSVFIELLVFFDLITLTRYFYIFWLKNPAGFNDEFWANFFHIWVKMFSFVFMSTFHIVSKHQSFNYYICSGLDPTTAILNPPRYSIKLLTFIN